IRTKALNNSHWGDRDLPVRSGEETLGPSAQPDRLQDGRECRPTWALPASDEVADVHSDVSCDHPQQRWRDVPARMEWDCRRPAVRMAVLPVGAALSNLGKAQVLQ